MTESSLRDRAERILVRLAGPQARLRQDQWIAIEALVEQRRRALVVQRTGWGKSAVYFVATALLREAGAGPTLIVSPLLALMRNQLDAAERAGIKAATINSANLTEWDGITARIAAGEIDLLLISPERLNNPDFRDNVLPKLAAATGLVVVDEAHAISDWGHDFRPDYRRIATLLDGLPPGIPVLATTATANARVTADVAEQIGEGDTLVLRGSLDRASLRLGVLSLPDQAHRLAWLADHLDDLPGSGIVYTLTVAATDEVAGFLRGRGFTVASYSGRTQDAERRQAESDLLAGRLKALIATSALGMGFDKPDLGFVVHLGAPPSPIAYYQQVGRAGRAVDRADVLLLPGREDEEIWRYFASLAFPPADSVRRTLRALADAGRPLSTAALETAVDLRRSRLELMLKVLDADGAVRRVRGGWEATGAEWAYDADRYERIAAARERERQAIRDYTASSVCRMSLLRQELDDPGLAGDSSWACGRCDSCAGPWYEPSVSPEALEAARSHLGRAGLELEPRKLWPTSMKSLGVDLSGKIAAAEAAATGRAIARLTDIGWGNSLRQLLADGTPDGAAPADMLAAAVQVLADWSAAGWSGERRPAGVAAIASRRHPRLVSSIAAHVCKVGRLPLLGVLERIKDTPPGGASNSAMRLRAVYDSFAVPDDLAAQLPDLAGSVLLVDDLTDSGWTLTVAARLLRQAGAPAVLPFTLAAAG